MSIIALYFKRASSMFLIGVISSIIAAVLQGLNYAITKSCQDTYHIYGFRMLIAEQLAIAFIVFWPFIFFKYYEFFEWRADYSRSVRNQHSVFNGAIFHDYGTALKRRVNRFSSFGIKDTYSDRNIIDFISRQF